MARLARAIALTTIGLPTVAFAYDSPISSGVIGGLAAAIVVPLAIALLRKVKAYQYRPSHATNSAKYTEKYRKWDRIARLLVLVYAPIIGGACWLIFTRIEALIAKTLGPADFVLTPIPVFFGLPALFAAILLSSIPLRWTLTTVLGEGEYQNLLNYSDHRQGFNSARLFRHMVYVGTTLITISVLLAWRSYAIITPLGLTIHPYFALHAQSYDWAKIRRITLVMSFSAPNGSIKHHPYYTIDTSDGGGINFHRSLLEVPLSEQRGIIEYIANHTKLRIDIEDPFPLH